jgi:predicted transcriptional regulator
MGRVEAVIAELRSDAFGLKMKDIARVSGIHVDSVRRILHAEQQPIQGLIAVDKAIAQLKAEKSAADTATT